MYTTTHNSFVSHLLGERRVYKFDKNKPGDKQRAEAEMKSDDAERVAATQARALATIGRELTPSELLRNTDFVKDARPLREKIKTDGGGQGSTQRSDSENPYRARVDFLERELANRPPREHAGIKMRLEMAIKSADAFDVQLAGKEAHAAKLNSTEVTDARLYGQAWIARLSTNPDPVCQPWLENYRREMAALAETGDTERFWKANAAFEAERTAVLTERSDALAEQSEKLKLAAAEVRETIEQPEEISGETTA